MPSAIRSATGLVICGAATLVPDNATTEPLPVPTASTPACGSVRKVTGLAFLHLSHVSLATRGGFIPSAPCRLLPLTPGFGPIPTLSMLRPFSAHVGHKRGIAMDRFVRACVSALLLAAAALAVGCAGSFTGPFSPDKFLEKTGGEGS